MDPFEPLARCYVPPQAFNEASLTPGQPVLLQQLPEEGLPLIKRLPETRGRIPTLQNTGIVLYHSQLSRHQQSRCTVLQGLSVSHSNVLQ